jgi:hypothetical protein
VTGCLDFVFDRGFFLHSSSKLYTARIIMAFTVFYQSRLGMTGNKREREEGQSISCEQAEVLTGGIFDPRDPPIDDSWRSFTPNFHIYAAILGSWDIGLHHWVPEQVTRIALGTDVLKPFNIAPHPLQNPLVYCTIPNVFLLLPTAL